MDARVEGMVYASIERPPVLGGKVKSYQDQEASRVPGVRQTVLVEPFKPPHGMQPLGGVAVIADKHLGGVSRPQETARGLGSRAQRRLQLRSVQEGTAADGTPAGQGHAQ